MNGNKWLIITGALAIAALLSFSIMKKMSKPLPKYVSEPLENIGVSNKQDTTSSQTDTKAQTKSKNKRNYDTIWQKSLFNDERVEGEKPQDAKEENVQGRPMTNSEFEVVGIARIGKADSAEPVAIIAQVKGNSRAQQNNQRPIPGRRMPPMPMRQQQDTKQENDPENRRVDKNIYRTGDKIGTTGYTVKGIYSDENKVVITRAGSDIELYLDVKNTSNSVRRETAKREAVEVQDKYKAQAKAEAQRVQTAKDQANSRAKMREQFIAQAKAQGRTITDAEINRRIEMTERFNQQRQQAEAAQRAMIQAAQQNMQNNQRNNQQNNNSAPPPPPGGGRFPFRNMNNNNNNNPPRR